MARKKKVDEVVDIDLVASRILQLIQDNDDYVGHVSVSIGLSRNALYQVIKKRCNPSAQMIFALCKYYDGVSADWILGLSNRRYK